MNDLGVDAKVVADQLGHTLEVNLNVYSPLRLTGRRKPLIV